MQQDKRALRILCLFGILPVTWLGLMIAPALSGGADRRHCPVYGSNARSVSY